jgi:hypothetical protein
VRVPQRYGLEFLAQSQSGPFRLPRSDSLPFP